jgi:hypothetical protein
MRTLPPRFLSLALVALCALTQLPPAAAQRRRPPAAAPAGTVIFSVKKYEANVQIEPIVILRGRTYAHPPVDEGDVTGSNPEAVAKRFINEYFRAGRQFRVLFGGGEDGSARVVKYVEPGCVGMYAEVTTDTSARLGGEVQALATNSKTIGGGPASRRAPTEAERAAALALARSAFARNGAPAALVRKMEVFNLTAADLDRDGKFELVGSFRIENNTETTFDAYALFMIFAPGPLGLKPALTWSHRGGETEYSDRRFVDHADLDGDGVSEVIAEGHYYESNDYFIYKKQRGQWRVVYHGGGGGC